MNILLTSVGRRAYMVKYFKEALHENGEVHVCNSDDLTVAFQYADHCFISPLIYDEAYIPTLLAYCQENHIDILLSLFDIDLYVLAQHKKQFLDIGTNVIISAPDFVEVCNDKWKTYEYLKLHGFYVPKTYLNLHDVKTALSNGELQYPIIVKPRFGCGSISLTVADNEQELTYFTEKIESNISKTYLKYESAAVQEKVVFQEMLIGQEYGADIINDLQGNFRNAIIKKKIAMRAGETDIAETVDNPPIYEAVKKLGQLTRHIANLDCDIFLVGEKPYILEMNARFGGGYPFSHIAGADLPNAILQWHLGEAVEVEMLCAKSGVRAFKELVLTVDR